MYIAGTFESPTIIFGDVTLTNMGFTNSYIAKYDSIGNINWAKSVGGKYTDEVKSICTDNKNNIYITGKFDSPTLTFGKTTLTNAGGYNPMTQQNSMVDDIFIFKYDSFGNTILAKKVGGTGFDEGKGIASDKSGNIYFTGMFTSPTIVFDNTILTNKNESENGDIFIVKLKK